MIVKVNNDVFEPNEHTIIELDKFLHIINDRHFWLIDNFDNIEIIKKSDWYGGLRKIYKDIIDNYIISSSTKEKRNVLTITNSDEYFNLDEANVYLSQPFIVILENSLNDGYFINALIKLFPKEGALLSKHYDNKWLEFGNGNGCTGIIHFINEKLNYYATLPKGSKNKYLRCFVLVDSDSAYPNMPYSNERIKLVHFLNENKIDFHILEKREMENYLPDEVISTIEDNDDFIQAYLRMKNPFQKDFFDLEEGFPNKNFDDLDDNIKKLYNNLSKEDKVIFRKKTLKLKGGFKTEISKLFFHEYTTKESLKNRTKHQVTDPNELENILNKIASLL